MSGVDRLPTEDGKTFTPDVLLVGGAATPAPTDATVTVKVVGQRAGRILGIGKYKSGRATSGTTGSALP